MVAQVLNELRKSLVAIQLGEEEDKHGWMREVECWRRRAGPERGPHEALRRRHVRAAACAGELQRRAKGASSMQGHAGCVCMTGRVMT